MRRVGHGMIPLVHMAAKRLFVFGLGRTGLTAIAALHAGGAQTLAWDDGEGRAQGRGGARLDADAA